jgi:hypothetical protein
MLCQTSTTMCVSSPVLPSPSSTHTPQWQAAYDELAKHVFANEPDTLTYYFGLPFEHADKPSKTDYMFAFEAYANRAALYETHLKSGPMTTAFLPTAGKAMTTGLDLAHFEAVGGFLDASGKKTECGVMHDMQIRCVDAARRAEFLGALRLLCLLVGERQKADGKGEVLTFLGCKSLDNDTGARLFARYKDRETWERWLRDGAFKLFWENVKPCIASMEARGYMPNGKGWLWK